MIRTNLRRISTSGHVLSMHRKDGEASKLKGSPWKERKDLPKMADYKLCLKMARTVFKIRVVFNGSGRRSPRKNYTF